MMKYLILALAIFTTASYAQDLEKVKDLNKETNSGKAFVMLEGPWNKSSIHLNGTMNPDDAGAVCNIEFGPTDYAYKKSVLKGVITHQYVYSIKGSTCDVQLTVGEQTAGLTGNVVLNGDCDGFCGMSGNPNVLNGYYKLAK